MAAKKKKSKGLRVALIVIVTLLLIGITTAAMCCVVLAVYVDRYINSDIDIDIDSLGLNFTSFVYYTDKQTGELKELEELHAGENRVWVNLDEIPEDLQNAFIAVEDQRFRTHKGVDWKRTIGAALSWSGLYDVKGGGSTITQQLIKNVTSDNEYSVQRKLREIFRALALERKYTKDQILELYLNTIFLGENCNGVQTAAQTYFGKDVSQLSLAECASIAGITKYPYKYDPFRNEDYNKERQELILELMEEQEIISEEECKAAKAQKLVFKKKEREEEKASLQSYYVDQVITDVLNDLMEEKGYSHEMAAAMLYNGGLRIETCIDPDIQAKMDEVFLNEDNFPSARGIDGSKGQAAMVIIDPYTGDVVAMYGGRGEKSGNRVLNRATQTKRSPGSSIKPLSVYAPAIEYGIITPASAMDDVPINFTIDKNGWPKNYYKNSANANGSGYKGRMSIAQAVEISNNTIPAQIINMLTPEKSYAFLSTKLGITSIVSARESASGRVLSDISGPASLSLGGLTDGMSVLELTAAYQPFVNGGLYYKPRTYKRVTDSSGNIVLDNTKDPIQAMSEKTAAEVRNLLEIVVYGKVGGATGTKAKIEGIRTAGKTGTTTDDLDRWFVGLTPYYVGAVWYGYDRQQEVIANGNPSLNLWKKVMDLVCEDLPEADFEDPEGFGQVTVCRDSGCIATEWCKCDQRGSRTITITMYKGDAPKTRCTLHQPVRIDASTNMLAGPDCPEENIKTVSMLAVERNFPINIHVDDAQYVISNHAETSEATTHSAQLAAAISRLNKLYSISKAYNEAVLAGEEYSGNMSEVFSEEQINASRDAIFELARSMGFSSVSLDFSSKSSWNTVCTVHNSGASGENPFAALLPVSADGGSESDPEIGEGDPLLPIDPDDPSEGGGEHDPNAPDEHTPDVAGGETEETGDEGELSPLIPTT